MEIYYEIDGYAAKGYRSRVALGFFDGVHLGHRAVIEACAEDCGAAMPVALTFRENPASALGRPAPPALSDNETKAALMSAAGARAVIFADFLSVKDMSPEEFVSSVLKDKLNAEFVCCGYDHRFGKNGSGSAERLRELCAVHGIECSVIEPVYAQGEAVSSTGIRGLLSSGEIEKANDMLGRAYCVSGVISAGNHIGSELGYPTVNLPMKEGLCVPRYGVYASRITVGGRSYPGATNIGVHPTVDVSPAPLCETFMIDYPGEEIYGEKAVVELLRFIRPEMKFASLSSLREQVERDVRSVRDNA